MKYLLIILVFLALCFISCKGYRVNGQQNQNGNSKILIESDKISPNNDKTDSTAKLPNTSNTQNEKPFANSINIEKSILKNEISFAERQSLRSLLNWKNACNFDSEKQSLAGRIRFLTLEIPQTYVVEVFCNQTGAYSFDYLLYYYDERNKSFAAKLLSFEYFNKNRKNRFVEQVTSNPSNVSFDENSKTVKISEKYSGAGQCGWEAAYKIEDAKSILVEMRAEWKCNPGTDYDNWEKLNLKMLRRKLRE